MGHGQKQGSSGLTMRRKSQRNAPRALRRSLAVVAIASVPLVGLGVSIAAARVAGATSSPHISSVYTKVVPTSVSCDTTGVYAGEYTIDYTVSAPTIDPRYMGSEKTGGWVPAISEIGSIQTDPQPISSTQTVQYVQYVIPGNTTQAGLIVQVDWSGPGLTSFTEVATGIQKLPGTCSSTSPPPPGQGCQIDHCVDMAPTPDNQGYWIVRDDGLVLNFGDAGNYGGLSGSPLNAPVVGITPTIDGKGYWLLAADGGVFSFGDAQFYGSTGNIHLNQPVVGMAATPSGNGYWFVASDGGIFSFGDAQFYGSTGNIHLNQPVVGMAATPSGHGYYLVASDGGLFSYGDARFSGSMGGTPLNLPVVGMAISPKGGYWEVAADGGIFAFGGAPFYGSTGNISLAQPIVAMTNTPSGLGYRFVAKDGGIFSYGDAGFYGSGV